MFISTIKFFFYIIPKGNNVYFYKEKYLRYVELEKFPLLWFKNYCFHIFHYIKSFYTQICLYK